jgi:hypothetical protein
MLTCFLLQPNPKGRNENTITKDFFFNAPQILQRFNPATVTIRKVVLIDGYVFLYRLDESATVWFLGRTRKL